MEARRIRREEMMDAERIRAISFHYPLNEEEAAERQAEVTDEQLRQSWGCFTDEGEMMACIINNDFRMRFDGRIVKMGGIGGVATLPEYRYGGAVKAIFAKLLRTAREEGEVFSALYPFSHEFYRKAGYEQIIPIVEYHFQPDLVSGYKHTGWTKRMKKGDDIGPMREVYAAYAERYNLMLDREDERFRIGDPFGRDQHTMLLGDERGAQAYLFYWTEQGSDGKVLYVKDIAFADAEGFRMCLGYLGRMSADYAFVKLCLPADIPLREMVPSPYDITIRFREQPMARTTNVPKALEIMKKPEDASFTIRVEDHFLPENSGNFRVTAQGVSETEEESDIEVSQQALTLMMLGALGLYEAEYRTDVKVYSNRDMLERVFVKKPLFISDYF